MNPFKKLTPLAQKELDKIEKYLEIIPTARVSEDTYAMLLKCIHESERQYFKDRIPYKGKEILRLGARCDRKEE